MSDATVREVAGNGLWHNNPALVQLLGLCPLLAVSSTVANALGLGHDDGAYWLQHYRVFNP
jgi:electron transport complex protein RnfE